MKPWEIALEVRDAKDKRARTKLYYPREATLEQVHDYTEALRNALRASEDSGGASLLQGAFTSYTITLPLELPVGLRATPEPSATVAKKMTLTWKGYTRVTISIPSWNEELTRYRELDRRTMDAANPDVHALITLLDNRNGGFYLVCDSKGYSLIYPMYQYLGSEMKWK